ncbi:MAG: hypothetical protein J1E62_09215 [Lachnospiraceae bacterium]|nr:hypothetical protein [Lachnospiraceae bacterium]
MKIKYALFEQKKNVLMTVFITLQTVMILFILVSIISAMSSRYEKYKPLEKFFKGDGMSMHVNSLEGRNGDRYLPFSEPSDLESYLKKAHIVCTYYVQMGLDIDHMKDDFESNGETPAFGYDDELINAYTPEMESGRWLRPGDAETDMLELVIFQKKQYYKVGDIITLTPPDVVKDPDAIKDSVGGKLTTAVQAKIVGILADGASPIMTISNYGQYIDFRDYYHPLYKAKEPKSVIFVSKRDIAHNNKLYEETEKNLMGGENQIWPYIISGPCFIWYDRGITEEEKSHNERFLTINGDYVFRHSSAEMRKNSMQYIMYQVGMLIPVLIGLIILTMVSIVSNTVIMVRQNMRNYSIYYMHGLTWGQCIFIHIKSIIITQSVTFLLSMVGIIICKRAGLLKNTVLILGPWQLVACIAVILLFIVFSIVISYALIGKKSAKTIFGEVE